MCDGCRQIADSTNAVVSMSVTNDLGRDLQTGTCSGAACEDRQVALVRTVSPLHPFRAVWRHTVFKAAHKHTHSLACFCQHHCAVKSCNGDRLWCLQVACCGPRILRSPFILAAAKRQRSSPTSTIAARRGTEVRAKVALCTGRAPAVPAVPHPLALLHEIACKGDKTAQLKQNNPSRPTYQNKTTRSMVLLKIFMAAPSWVLPP